MGSERYRVRESEEGEGLCERDSGWRDRGQRQV